MLLVADEGRELLPLLRALIKVWFPGSGRKVPVIIVVVVLLRLYFFFLVLRW